VPGKQTYDSMCDALGDCVCPELDGISLSFTEENGCVSGKVEFLQRMGQ
jgi:hypothetical protein